MPSKRIFVAIGIPPEIRSALATCKEEIPLPGLSWVKEENLHITVLFLGETSENDLTSIEHKLSVLSTFSPFFLQCKEVIPVTRRGKLSMIWAGFEQCSAFVQLATLVSKVLSYPPDHSPVPHVTLARVKRGQFIKTGNTVFPPVSSYSWQVQKIGLWASVLSPQGSVYTVIREWKLTESM
jgi:2'-5' RNA ligase